MATIEQRLHTGDEARQVLENPAFIAAFDSIEQEIYAQWKSSPARDEEGRQRLYQFSAMLAKLKQVLTNTLETGKLAKLELEHKRTLQERAKDFLE